jgi:hypothetical protein
MLPSLDGLLNDLLESLMTSRSSVKRVGAKWQREFQR